MNDFLGYNAPNVFWANKGDLKVHCFSLKPERIKNNLYIAACANCICTYDYEYAFLS